MISPPGSLGSVNQHTVEEDAVFLTPPEHHSHPHLSSSEDQNPNEYRAEEMAVAEAGEGSPKVRVSEAGLDDEPDAKRVRVEAGEEFEGETDETEVVEIAGDGSVQDTDVVSDNGDSGGEETDTLRLAEGSLDLTGEAVAIGGLMKDGEAKFDAINGSHELGEKHELVEDSGNKPSGNSDSSLDIDKIEGEILMLKDIVSEKCSEVKLKSGSEKVDEISKDAETRKDIHIDGGVRTNGERMEEIDVNRTGGAAGVSGPRRQLPPSLKGKEKEAVGDWEKWEKKGLLELLDDLKAVLEDTVEDNSKEVDIVETVKKKGGTFPRPRWWPPEGEDWSYGLP